MNDLLKVRRVICGVRMYSYYHFVPIERSYEESFRDSYNHVFVRSFYDNRWKFVCFSISLFHSVIRKSLNQIVL